MKFHTTYIIQFSPIDLPQSDILADLNSKLPNAEMSAEMHLTEGLSEYFSNVLYINDFPTPSGANLKIETAQLTIFDGGFGTYQLTANLPETVSTHTLVEITDALTDHLEEHIKIEPKIRRICEHFGNWFTDDENDKNQAKLMWAYSQTCVFEAAENFERFCRDLSDEEYRTYEDCKVLFDPTATVLFFNKEDRMKTALQLIKSVTLSTALAYNIQNTAIRLSRTILQDPKLEAKFSSIDKYVRLVNIMDQYLTEIYQDDLIANLNEVVFAKPLSLTFELSEVLQKGFKAVARLKEHVQTLENEITRRQQNRMNNILFIFTLLSIVSLVGGVISLYDFTNQISSKARMIIVATSFLITAALVIFLLNKLSDSKFKRKRYKGSF